MLCVSICILLCVFQANNVSSIYIYITWTHAAYHMHNVMYYNKLNLSFLLYHFYAYIHVCTMAQKFYVTGLCISRIKIIAVLFHYVVTNL
jgi:hypothetical protein